MKFKKNMLKYLASLPLAALPLAAISCKDDLSKVTKNLKIESKKDVSTIKASEFKKEDLKTNLDNNKYEIVDLELFPDDEKGELTLTYKVKSKTSSKTSDLIKKVITGFKKSTVTPPTDPILKELEEEAKKIKAKISKTISDTLVNDLKDEDVELEGYDKSKYNINDLTLDKSKANQGILKLSYKLVSQINPDKRIERTLEVSGFKIPTTPPAPSSKVLLEKEGESDAKMEAGWTLDSSLTIDKLNKEPQIKDPQWFTKFSEKKGVKSFFMDSFKDKPTLLRGKSPSNKPFEGPELMDFSGVIPSNLSYTNHLNPLYKNKNNGKIKSSGFLEFKEENGKYVIRFRLFDFKNKKVSKMVYKLVFEK